MLVIGEKINATLERIKKIILNRDSRYLMQLAKNQAAAGANFIDVNVGTGVGSQADEVDAMQWAIETIREAVEIPICIDSVDPVVLETGLKILSGESFMINSANAEPESLDRVVPLTGKYNAFLIALTMDEDGIPKTVAGRLQACEKILSSCEQYGVPFQNVYIDPLVLPISTDIKSGTITIDTLKAIKETFPDVKTITGLSNISYGLPARRNLNAAFLHMCIYAGLDAAIIDPMDIELMTAVRAGEVLIGKDRHCRRYTRYFRNPI
jgi:5-methyltetrahydrofolate--homocysteine methyltransferase